MRASILVVDNDPAIPEVLVDILEQSGYRCRMGDTGAEALDILQEHPFDIVISDFMMPGINGFQLMKQGSRNPARDAFYHHKRIRYS